MIQKSFISNVKNLARGEDSNPQQIWPILQKQNFQGHVSLLSQELFQSLFEPYFKKKKRLVKNEYNIVNTLFLIQFYKDRLPKTQQFVKSLKKCKNNQQRLKENYQLEWLIDMALSNNKEQCFIKTFIYRLVCVPENLDWNGNVQLQIQRFVSQNQKNDMNRDLNQKSNQFSQRIRYFTYPSDFRAKNYIFSCSYVCFLDYVRENVQNIKTAQYLQISKCLHALMNYSKSHRFGQNLLIAFIQFVIHCFTFYSSGNDIVFKEFLVTANTLRCFYGAIGELGHQLFQLVVQQLKIPGFAFRKRLRYDFPALDIKQNNSLNKQFYLVSNSQDSFSHSQDCSLINLRKLMIWHLMKISGLSYEQIEKEIPMLKDLAFQLTYQVYFKLMKIIDICSQLDVYEQTIKILNSKMKDLLSQTRKKFNSQGKRATAQQAQQFEKFLDKPNNLHIFQYPKFEIIHAPLAQFVLGKSQINFFSVIKKFRAYESHLLFYQNRISIIFYGTSLDFISLLSILCRFLQQADIQQCRQLQLYYLPKKESQMTYTIADYLASKDIWYCNHIYKVFKQNCVYPNLQIKSKNKRLFPSYILNKSLHMYIREAKRIFKWRVYKCQVKIKDQKQIQTIYFTSSIMIGILAEAEILRQNKLKSSEKTEKYHNRSSLEIIKQKINKYNPFIVDISYQSIQNITGSIITKKQKNLKLYDLQICSMPKQNFFGQNPDPGGKNGLKLSLLTENNGLFFHKQINNKQNFRQNKSSSEVFLAFKDLFINQSIKSLSLRNNSTDKQQLFKLIIDGVAYMKVQGIDIYTPMSTNGFPVCIPIMTFLPFA